MDQRTIAARDAGVVVSVETARQALWAMRMAQLRMALERAHGGSAAMSKAADELEAALAHPVATVTG